MAAKRTVVNAGTTVLMTSGASARALTGEYVRRAQQGDIQAMGKLVDRHFKDLEVFIGSRVRDCNQRADIYQEVWSTAMEELKTMEEPEAFRPWLMKIALTKCANFFRGKERAQKNEEKY